MMVRNRKTSKEVSACLVSVEVHKGAETSNDECKESLASNIFLTDQLEEQLDDLDDEIELKAFESKIDGYTVTLKFEDPAVEKEYLKKCKIKADPHDLIRNRHFLDFDPAGNASSLICDVDYGLLPIVHATDAVDI